MKNSFFFDLVFSLKLVKILTKESKKGKNIFNEKTKLEEKESFSPTLRIRNYSIVQCSNDLPFKSLVRPHNSLQFSYLTELQITHLESLINRWSSRFWQVPLFQSMKTPNFSHWLGPWNVRLGVQSNWKVAEGYVFLLMVQTMSGHLDILLKSSGSTCKVGFIKMEGNDI